MGTFIDRGCMVLRYTRLNSSACAKHNDDISCDGAVMSPIYMFVNYWLVPIVSYGQTNKRSKKGIAGTHTDSELSKTIAHNPD